VIVLALLEDHGAVLAVDVLADLGLVGFELDLDVLLDLVVHGDRAVLIVQMLLLFFFPLVRVAEKILECQAIRVILLAVLVRLNLINLDEAGLNLSGWRLDRLGEKGLSSDVVHVGCVEVLDLICQVCQFLVLVLILHRVFEAPVHFVVVN